MARRSTRMAVTMAVTAALAAPVVLDRDDFPLSTYPMYSWARPAEVDFVIATGIGPGEDRRRLSLPLIGASDDPLIVAGELRSAVRAGRADARCVEIASRVARSDEAGALVAVEVVTERHDVVALVADRASELNRTVHARCEVDRP